MTKAKKITQYVAALFAVGYSFTYGTLLGWSNPIEPFAKDGKLGFDVSNEEFSWIGAIVSLGATVACIPTGFLLDIIGRKPSMLLLGVPVVIGWIIILLAKNSLMLVAARAIQGWTCGATSVVVPMYTSEIAQKEIRGGLSALFHLWLVTGILYVYVIGAFVEPLILNICCIVVPILCTISTLLLPETPLFHVKKGRIDRAEKAFRWLRGKYYDASDEIDNIKTVIDKAHERGVSFKSSIMNRACLRALFITLAMMFFQQFCGIKIVIFYSTEIFKYADTNLKPSYCTIVVGIVQVLATVFAVLFVDKLGRRLLLLISAAAMTVSLCALGVYCYLKDRDSKSIETIGWIPLNAMCLYIITYSIGFGPVSWILLGELFPPEIRGRVGSIASTLCWFSAFSVAKLFPTLRVAIGSGEAFWVFTFLTFLSFLFVLFFVPETKNKSLTEIQEILNGSMCVAFR